jgi:hypothetical protein
VAVPLPTSTVQRAWVIQCGQRRRTLAVWAAAKIAERAVGAMGAATGGTAWPATAASAATTGGGGVARTKYVGRPT